MLNSCALCCRLSNASPSWFFHRAGRTATHRGRSTRLGRPRVLFVILSIASVHTAAAPLFPPLSLEFCSCSAFGCSDQATQPNDGTSLRFVGLNPSMASIVLATLPLRSVDTDEDRWIRPQPQNRRRAQHLVGCKAAVGRLKETSTDSLSSSHSLQFAIRARMHFASASLCQSRVHGVCSSRPLDSEAGCTRQRTANLISCSLVSCCAEPSSHAPTLAPFFPLSAAPLVNHGGRSLRSSTAVPRSQTAELRLRQLPRLHRVGARCAAASGVRHPLLDHPLSRRRLAHHLRARKWMRHVSDEQQSHCTLSLCVIVSLTATCSVCLCSGGMYETMQYYKNHFKTNMLLFEYPGQ